jgi:hypothetical protein
MLLQKLSHKGSFQVSPTIKGKFMVQQFFVPEVVRRYMKNDLGEKNDYEALRKRKTLDIFHK